MVSLPPISLHIFETQILADPTSTISGTASLSSNNKEESDVHSPTHLDDDLSDSNTTQTMNVAHCMFCATKSRNLHQNMIHMASAHGFYVPNLHRLTDLETFVEYLSALVIEYNECLYCGHHKSSIPGIRQHMVDKGHCMLNLDADPDLLDFWDSTDSSASEGGTEKGEAVERQSSTTHQTRRMLSATELQLPSGAIITSRSHGQVPGTKVDSKYRATVRRAKLKALEQGTDDDSGDNTACHPKLQRQTHSRDQRLAIRGEQGMVGVPEQQRKSLLAVEKKLLKREVMAKAHQRWTIENVANKQKRFKLCPTRYLDVLMLHC